MAFRRVGHTLVRIGCFTLRLKSGKAFDPMKEPPPRLVESTTVQGPPREVGIGKSSDEERRFQHFTVFLALGVPTMLIFLVANVARGNLVLAGAIGASAAALTGGWVLTKRFPVGMWVYRANAFLFAGLILYMLCLGGIAGSKILWMYTFPLISLFLLGKNEGLVWALLVSSAAGVLLPWSGSLPWVYEYPQSFQLRFFLTYLMVVAITYWFESSRSAYRRGMEAEHGRLSQEIADRQKTKKENEALILELKAALSEVETLHGLLPICAYCQRIRDDDGYWNRVEKFIQDRFETTFSHGICPTCLEEHFPDVPTDPADTESLTE